ncbi:MAG: hypothetical protein JO257_26960 [Deltaproteobacteria bacterium]|nr:hypothetical protein [Deltaproteobacteria bacterium]
MTNAIVRFYDACGRPARWINAWPRNGVVKRRTFRPGTLNEVIRDEEMTGFTVTVSDDATEHCIRCFLRPLSPDTAERELRWVTLTATGLPFETPAVRDLLEAVIDVYPIIQGSVGGYRSLTHAAQECCFSGAVSAWDLDDATRGRLKVDQRLDHHFKTTLRRLYPITIIGAELWRPLPPVPAVDPMPRVEAIGDCKLIHAWPTLVEPRDPEFLAGTIELRRWLWPHTIQNPADAIEA